MSRASKRFSILLPFVVVTIGAVCVLVRAEGVKGPAKTDLNQHRVKRGWFRWGRRSPPPPPPPVHGGWSSYRAVGGCSRTCGTTGQQRYERSCNNPVPRNGGRPCSGLSWKYEPCNRKCCPVHGGWSSWSFGPCSKTCGKGVQMGRRTCTNPTPYCGGRRCAGIPLQARDCFKACPSCSRPGIPAHVSISGTIASSYVHGAVLSYSCHRGYHLRVGDISKSSSSVRCDAGRWTRFVPCVDTNECLKGTHGCDLTRSRCVNTNGGFHCKCHSGYIQSGNNCRLPVINGGWSGWRVVGVCSASCGGGRLRYERRCDNPPPQNGGRPCAGLDNKFEPCNTQCCPVNGGWSSWSNAPCSKTCSRGLRTRHRTCTNPPPTCGGKDCVGINSIQEECMDRLCNNCTVPSARFFAERTGMMLDEHTIVDKVPTGTYPSGAPYFEHGVKVPYGCQSGFEYVDTLSSTIPTIDCDHGHWYGGKACTDVDECLEGIHSCNPLNSECVNSIGSYRCPCIGGFRVDDDGSGKCTDINECRQSPPPCDQLCRNDQGSYQCYCKDAYVFNDTTSLCQRKYKECSELPELVNGQTMCRNLTTGRICDLTCNEGYEFTTSEDHTPQQCIDGHWTYQRSPMPVAYPTCEEVFGSWLEDFFSVPTNETCDFDSDLSASALGGTDDLEVDSVSCEPLFEFKRRAVGRVVFRLVLRRRLNATCGKGCLEEESKENEKRIISRLTSPDFRVEIRSGSNITEASSTSVSTDLVTHVDTKRVCSTAHRLIKGVCSICPPGYTYNTSVESCDPCDFGTYKDSPGPQKCVRCKEGLYTRIRGATTCEEKCPPGSHSEDGYPPCDLCPRGTYQNEEGADFCYHCDFEWTTRITGATSVNDCGCPAGRFGQDCTLTCSCTDNGYCTPDGCVCLHGWTGEDCSLQQECTGTYYVSFLNNYRKQNTRKLYILSGSLPLNASIQVTTMSTTTQHSEMYMEVLNFTTLEIPPNSGSIARIQISPDTSAEVIGVNEEYGSADAFASIPVTVGAAQEYFAVSIATNSFFAGRLNGVIQVIASGNNTTIKISLLVDATVDNGGRVSKQSGGTSYQAVLNQGEMLSIASGGDLTGTRITSSSGVSVYSGHECAFVPVSDLQSGCDHLVEQMPPTSVWGTEYIVTPFFNRNCRSHVKIVSAQPSTSVSIQCVDGQQKTHSVVLGVGESYNFTLKNHVNCRIVSNYPILVAHFAPARGSDFVGAPFLLLVPDVHKSLGNTSFLSTGTTYHKLQHYVTFIVKGISEFSNASVSLDGSLVVPKKVRCESLEFQSGEMFLVVHMSVGEGYHRLQHDMLGQLFGLLVYGFTRDASYGYSMGYHQATRCESKL